MNREELKQVLDNNEYVVLKFGAEWCGPCKQIAPVLEQLADEYQDRIKYVSIDVEESTHLAKGIHNAGSSLEYSPLTNTYPLIESCCLKK